MKPHILGIALLAACASAFAQTQSGSSIGGSSILQPRPLPQPLPSTGTSADTAGAQGTAPRTPETSVGTSGIASGPLPDRASGRCDTLLGEERAQCLREQASTGTTGAGSTGMGAGPR